MRKLLFSLFLAILGLFFLKNPAFAATYSSYLQPNSCTTGPDGGTTASTFIVDKFVGSTTQYFCFNPNIGNYYTQGNSCTLSPLNLDPNADNISGHTYLVRKRTDSSGHTIYDCVADCTKYPNFPHCPVINPAPIGSLDSGVPGTNGVAGWACDASDYTQQLTVKLYLDTTSSTPIQSVTANVNRPDVGTANVCNGTSNHGFAYTLPSSVCDGQKHTIIAVAQDYPTSSNNPTLPLSGGATNTFTCTPPPPPSNPTTQTQPTNAPPQPTSGPIPTTGNLSVQIEGIGLNDNANPLHPTRQVVLYFYGSTDTTFHSTPYIATGNVTYNPTTGNFSNASFPLTGLVAGQYLVLVRTLQGSLVGQIGTGDGTGPITIVNTGGANYLVDTQNSQDQNADTTVPILLMGDIVPTCSSSSSCDFNHVYTLDYNAIVDCFGSKSSSVACIAHGVLPGTQDPISDLNDDGQVDGTDYTMLMKHFGSFGIGQQSMNRGNPAQ